ncbi:hypothetical protein HOA93_03275 [bacterium]|nr:hypothetical protein [bacterium]
MNVISFFSQGSIVKLSVSIFIQLESCCHSNTSSLFLTKLGFHVLSFDSKSDFQVVIV